MKTKFSLPNLRKKFRFIHELTNTNVAIERRITMIIALAGAIGNTLGFIANFFLYGMNIPTACCAICALLLLLNAMFGLNSTHCRALGWAEIILLDVFEFPFLVLTYGAVMYPYLMLGFVALLMLATGRRRLPLCVLLALYDLAIIVYSSLHPYLFGPQDPMGLMGSAIATFSIALCAMSACIIAWQGVSVLDSNELDSTTGLLTRAGFLRSAGELLTEERSSDYAILYFNIMNFKIVNSLCNLEGGNRLLKQYGQILKNSPLQPKLTCRMNADRFVCLINRDRLDYQHLNDLCELQFDDNGKSIPLTVHCGIFFPEEGDTDISSMVDKAHLSERSVRGVQEQHYVLYDRGYSAVYQQETELLAELDSALREQVFVPYYQPVVDCKTGKIVSAEALARWVHPQRGVLAPGAFIPILERKELISELDSMILDKVNAFLTAQEQAGSPIVPVSVNLSRIDLYNNRLMEQIRAQLTEQAASSHINTRFELTESAYESLPESTLNLLAELRSAGAKILLDDFGTGYSSLGMITDCEFDIIKLDKSFADRLESSEKVRGIVLSLIEMVHKLNATVIMEGVENSAQLEYLTSVGCDMAQGYLFYRPMPEAEFAELLKQQNK